MVVRGQLDGGGDGLLDAGQNSGMYQ